MIYVWGVLSSILVLTCEVLFKTQGAYWRYAYVFVPVALAINYSIFRLVNEAPSLPAAFVVFSATNVLMRTALSAWLGHPMSAGTWAAVGLMLSAAVVRHRWP